MRLKNTLLRGVAAAVIAGIVVTSGLPVYAKTWDISEGSITVEADGEEDGGRGDTANRGDDAIRNYARQRTKCKHCDAEYSSRRRKGSSASHSRHSSASADDDTYRGARRKRTT